MVEQGDGAGKRVPFKKEDVSAYLSVGEGQFKNFLSGPDVEEALETCPFTREDIEAITLKAVAGPAIAIATFPKYNFLSKSGWLHWAKDVLIANGVWKRLVENEINVLKKNKEAMSARESLVERTSTLDQKSRELTELRGKGDGLSPEQQTQLEDLNLTVTAKRASVKRIVGFNDAEYRAFRIIWDSEEDLGIQAFDQIFGQNPVVMIVESRTKEQVSARLPQ